MPDIAAIKADLRAVALARRAALPAAERTTASALAAARLAPFVRPGETVSLFWPMRDEVDPRSLIAIALDAGGRVAMPVVEKRRMFFRLFDGEDCLEPGTFGTRHPRADRPPIDPDFIVAPLAAFDRRGGRIGYGAGYYDQAIADLVARRLPPRIAGIAFACQEVDAVPVAPHDAALAMIATERALIVVEANA